MSASHAAIGCSLMCGNYFHCITLTLIDTYPDIQALLFNSNEDVWRVFCGEENNYCPHGNSAVSVASSSARTWRKREKNTPSPLKAEVILNQLIKAGCCQNIRSSPSLFCHQLKPKPLHWPPLFREGEHEGGRACLHLRITAVEL